MALARLPAGLLFAALLAAPRLAGAQAPAPPPASAPASAPASQATLEPPRPLVPTTIPYPAGAPPHTQPVVVRAKLFVGADGLVHKVELLTRSLPIFDDAVVRAAQAFRFAPARYGGQPVPVAITYTHTFQPPPPPPPKPQEGPPLVSALRGRLREMGTRAPLSGATVAALVDGIHYAADTDKNGRFRLPLPPGAARITVHAAGYKAFLQEERLAPKQELAVTYYVEREQYDPYEIIVVREQRREEVSRVTLRGPEIQQIPGTFGDPFRVIQALPGTAAVMSLLPFPVVRGASPSSTGYLLDGTRVPMLYHLLVGTSVIHPELIDEVQFFPGGAPANYGGYTGGIVDGRTRRARADEHLIDLDANLLEAGGFVREPIRALGITVTAAARYGYPGLILSLATDQASLSYWDYQLRVDGGTRRNGWTFFAFGAGDELDTPGASAAPGQPSPPLEPAMVMDFHRVDLRAYHGQGGFDGLYRIVLGYDHLLGAGADVSNYILEPALHWSSKLAPSFTLNWGLDGSLRHFVQGATSTLQTDAINVTTITQDLHSLYWGSAFLDAVWRPTPRWLIRPGVRGDLYYDGTTSHGAVDPRLTVRYKLFDRRLPGVRPGSDDGAVWLKGAVGSYNQPPRFVLPLPGMDVMPLKYGLLRSIQTSLGVEVPFAERTSLSVEGYYSSLDPTIFDLAFNATDLSTLGNISLFPGTTAPGTSRAQEALDRLMTKETGRAYGLELLLRREATRGFFGWISYTLSRSQRERDGQWGLYDFDRTHILNLIAGLRLPRNWDLGLRFQYQSGRPATTTYGYNTARTDGYMRIDVRCDKRAVFRGWLLDFYVDLINAALLPEELLPGRPIRYVLPSAGIRGRI